MRHTCTQVRQFDLLRMFAGNGKTHDSAEPLSHMVVSVAGSHAADSALYNSGELLGEPDCGQGHALHEQVGLQPGRHLAGAAG